MTSPWAFDSHYRALSYAFRVRTNDARAGRWLEPLLAPFSAPPNGVRPAVYSLVSSPAGREHDVFLDGRQAHRSESLDLALDWVVWSAGDEAVERTERFLALHAGAVSWRGSGVLLPAPPNSGKTTLVAALIQRGFRYLTDEYAVVDLGSGRLHPFPRPLWLAPESIELLKGLGLAAPALIPGDRAKWFVSAEDVGTGGVGDPCPVRHVISPAYEPYATASLEPVARAEMLLELADDAFNFRRHGAPALDLLRDLLAGADCYRLRMGDLGAAVELVRELVGADDRAEVMADGASDATDL